MRRTIVIAAATATAAAAATATAATAGTAASFATASGPPHASGCAPVLAHHILPRVTRCLGVLRADVTGGSGTELVVLGEAAGGRVSACGGRAGGFSLYLVSGGGATVRTQLPCSNGRPHLVRAGDNVNGVPGIELVVELDEISSGNTYGVYTFDDGRLSRVGPLLSAGGDSVTREGFACRTGPRPTLVQRIMDLRHGHGTVDGPWRWTVITYGWRGSTLERIDRRKFVRRGLPHGKVIADGFGCGRMIGPSSR